LKLTITTKRIRSTENLITAIKFKTFRSFQFIVNALFVIVV